MKHLLHITSGDIAGDNLKRSGIPGEVFVWHDILYDGLRKPGWPEEDTLHDRARFLEEQLYFAERVDRAFAIQDKAAFVELSKCRDVPLPWIPAAVTRWLQERPDEATELGRLEQLALEAIRSGSKAPSEIFTFTAAHDTHPLFWGDIALWAKINKLATRRPPLVRLEGPKPRLPQWNDKETLEAFRVYPA